MFYGLWEPSGIKFNRNRWCASTVGTLPTSSNIWYGLWKVTHSSIPVNPYGDLSALLIGRKRKMWFWTYHLKDKWLDVTSFLTSLRTCHPPSMPLNTMSSGTSPKQYSRPVCRSSQWAWWGGSGSHTLPCASIHVWERITRELAAATYIYAGVKHRDVLVPWYLSRPVEW
jgi:hypothetical protein